jgi:hypothetical protein
MPTRPPRVPLSEKSEFAGTVICTPSNCGFAASTDGAKVITVSWVADWLQRSSRNPRQKDFTGATGEIICPTWNGIPAFPTTG